MQNCSAAEPAGMTILDVICPTLVNRSGTYERLSGSVEQHYFDDYDVHDIKILAHLSTWHSLSFVSSISIHTSTCNMILTLPSALLLLAINTLSFANARPAPTPNILAGGPAVTPIPSNCTITNLAPTLGQMRNESYVPTASAGNDILYSAYYPPPSVNTTTMSMQCLEQCHGYGDGSQCKTAFWAEKMPVPKGYYGTPGGQLETACLFFTRALGDDDFMAAPEGEASNAFAWSLQC
jgi:hypothetical protein